MEVSGNFTPQLLYIWETTLYWLNRRLVGLQSQSGHFGEEKNLLPLLGFETRTMQAIVLLQYWLHYPGSHLNCKNLYEVNVKVNYTNSLTSSSDCKMMVRKNVMFTE
jgi:hypothetical protein